MTPIEKQYDTQRMIAAFDKEMRGRIYSDDATSQAFAWFRAGWEASQERVPDKKEYQHGRDFFQGEGQEVANAKVDGWNECRQEMLK